MTANPSGSSTKISNVAITSGVTAISAGWSHSCAMKDGAPYCWGMNFHGETGQYTSYAPAPLQNLGMTPTGVHAGANFTCITAPGVATRCFGIDQFGELGIGGRNYFAPADVIGNEYIFFDSYDDLD